MANQTLIDAFNNQAIYTTAGNDLAFRELTLAGVDLPAVRQALIAHKAFWLNFGFNDADFVDDDAFIDAGADDTAIEVILQMAASARVSIVLQDPAIDDAVLNAFIKANDEAAIRQLLDVDPTKAATGDLTRIPGWDPLQNTIITDEATRQLQALAKKSLLLKKINALRAQNANEVPEVTRKLNALLTANNDATFRAAAQAIGIADNDVLAQLNHGNMPPDIFSLAAKKSFLLNAEALFNNAFGPGKIDASALLIGADNAFSAGLPVPYQGKLRVADVADVKAELGKHFLKANMLQKTPAALRNIAQAAEVDALRVLLKRDPQDTFVDIAVTEDTKKEYRHAAAQTLLTQHLLNSRDTAALSALAGARNFNDFLSTLTRLEALGLAGDANKAVREAFDPALVNETLVAILPTAYIRLDMLNGEAAHLEALLTAPDEPDTFAQAYSQEFNILINLQVYVRYFEKATNRQMVREQALLALTQRKLLSENNHVLIQAVADAADTQALQDAIRALLGTAAANGLINPANALADTPLYQNLQTAAQFETRLRAIEAGVYANMAAAINGLEAEFPNMATEELHHAELRLVKSLLKKTPALQRDALNKLVTASNEAGIKNALHDLGINQHGFVTKQNMKELQAHATAGLFNHEINAASSIGENKYPELLRLLMGFPFEKQQAIFANPLIIPALLRVQSANELKAILKIPSTAITPELTQEYERIALSRRIHNAAIGNILAGLPTLTLSSDMVDNINTLLHDNARARFGGAADFINSIRDLRGIVAPDDEVSFNRAFGLNDAGNAEVNQAVGRDLVHNQHQWNGPLFVVIDNVGLGAKNDAEKDILRRVACLTKGEVFPGAQIDPLIAAFNDATSRQDLLTRINALPLSEAMKNTFAKELSLVEFNQLKRPLRKAKFLSPATFQATINANNVILNTQQVLFDELSDKHKGARKELERLSHLKALKWLSPAFQALAMKHANELEPHFAEIAKGCDIIALQLEDQLNTVREQLRSLPSDVDINLLGNPQRKELIAYRDKLKKRDQIIEEQFAMYSRMQRVLTGDPDAQTPLLRKGVLQTIRDAKETRQEIKFLGYASASMDYPLSEKKAHLERGYTGQAASELDDTLERNIGTGLHYEATPDNLKVEEGFFREYTIGTGPLAGHFIEERGVNDAKAQLDEKGNVSFEPAVKFTLNKFPTLPPLRNGQPAPMTQALHDARVQFATAVIAQALSGSQNMPTPDDPIVLKGSNGEKLLYLWTALMVVGVDPKAIKVVSTAFNPADRMGTLYGYVNTFGTDNEFTFDKNHPAVNNILTGMKELSDEKKGSWMEQRLRADVLAKARKTSTMFKENLGGARGVTEKFAEENAKTDTAASKPPTLS